MFAQKCDNWWHEIQGVDLKDNNHYSLKTENFVDFMVLIKLLLLTLCPYHFKIKLLNALSVSCLFLSGKLFNVTSLASV